MNKLLFTAVVILFFTGCKKQEKECLSYDEALARGIIAYKTSDIIVNDSLRFTLNHVMDKNDDVYGKYCVGVLALKQESFNEAVSAFLKGYDLKKVRTFIPHFEGVDLCNGKIPDITKDVKGYVVYYCDMDNNVVIDYVNLTTHKRETHKVSEAYGSVKLYYLFKSVTSKNPASAITIKMKVLYSPLIRLNF